MRSLYVTYTALTDYIGQSQVLPYLVGLARNGNRLTVISFEKTGRLARIGGEVRQVFQREGIEWMPQRFHSRPPVVAKFLDQLLMQRAAMQAAKGGGFDMVHCRGYTAALVGLRLKRSFGLPLLFDMRGFWPDSRREGGRWKDEHPVGSRIFRRWKQHEARLIAGSDHIVSLTHAAKREMATWSSYGGAPISVIPCCADFTAFPLTCQANRERARQALDIPPGAPTLVYLGSLGSIYLLGEKLDLFGRLRAQYPDAKLLFVGRDTLEQIGREAQRVGRTLPLEHVRQVESERAEVPFWLGAADMGLCFYTPTYSSLHVSPTKLGEYLACGLPAYCNRGVGDVEAVLARTGGGHVLPDFSQRSINDAVSTFEQFKNADRAAIRAEACKFLDLPHAVNAYADIYSALDCPHEVR